MIPHIIHQTWKTHEIPLRFRYIRDSWLMHHPDWEYRLWSDADNRAFLVENYPAFLSVYDSYQTPICRADAIRYFLLKHFGGLYVDLDFECFQPFDTILNSQSVVLGLEPQTHLHENASQHQGLTRIVCNALMASPPQHPFWDHVIDAMVAARNEPGPLNATGPFLLTRAVDSYSDCATVEVTPDSFFYPADAPDCALGRLFDLENWQRVTAGAHAMHHWAGTWWRESEVVPSLPSDSVKVALVQGGRHIAESSLNARQCAPLGESSPLVSCLMVTRNRSGLARCATNSFRAQTYPSRELVILDDGQDRELEIFVQSLADPRIRYLRLPDAGATLGALRNQAVALARGTYICQWDDDDLYHPARLEMQMTALVAMRADACFLNRWVIWWPKQKRLAVSMQRIWEGSMLCLKSKMGLYPTIRRGEDTPVAEQIVQTERVVVLDQPRLYVYIVHEGNTFESSHFESHWESASQQFSGAGYERVMQELGKGLNFDDYLAALNKKTEGGLPESIASATNPAHETENVGTQKRDTTACHVISSPVSPVLAEIIASPRIHEHLTEFASVLILTPVKNAARFLDGFFDLATRLDYPRDKLSLAFLEGDSEDGSYQHLQDCANRCHGAFARIDLHRLDFSFRMEGERWRAEKQFLRRSVISKCRNRLFQLADRGEDRVLWIDADVIDYSPDVLLRLLEARKPIVVPNCVQISGGPTFDLNTFKFKPGAERLAWTHLLDGIIQPPRGLGRLYLEDFRGMDMVELDGVGGTMLLLDADLHRHGILFPDYSYRGYLDTEGFAMHAKDRGISAWGLPDIEIVHASQ